MKRLIHRAGRVLRYHNNPTIHKQSVGEHSWGVAMFARELWPTDYILIKACLVHDVPEVLLGDIPADATWRYGELEAAKRLSEEKIAEELKLVELRILPIEQRERLKICDTFESMRFCMEEMRLGNTSAARIFELYYANMKPRIDMLGREAGFGEAREMFYAMESEFQNLMNSLGWNHSIMLQETSNG